MRTSLHTRWIVRGVVLLLAIPLVLLLWCLFTINPWSPVDLFERAISACRQTAACPPTEFYVGHHTARISATTTLAGDNGPATVHVSLDDAPPIDFTSEYNYDTFINIAPVIAQWRWIDGDWRPDLVLQFPRNRQPTMYVSSRDGQLHDLAPTIESTR